MANGKSNTKRRKNDELEEAGDDPATTQARRKQTKQDEPEEVDKSKVDGSEQDLGGDRPTDADGSDPSAGDNLGKKGAKPVDKNAKNKTHPSDADDEVPDKNSMIKQEEQEIEVDVTEDVKALLNGESDLSEEFQNKAQNIFEAAVKAKVKEERDKIAEQFENQLDEQLDKYKDELVEGLDSYLNFVVEEWMEENKVALEKGIKGEIVEEFMSGLKSLFETHNIDVPEEKYDVLEEITTERDNLEKQLDEAVNKRAELQRQLAELKKKEIVREYTDDLTESQAEKIVKLSETVDYKNEDKFRENVKLFRENYFPTDAKVANNGSEGEEELLKEEEDTEEANNLNESDVTSRAKEFLNKTA